MGYSPIKTAQLFDKDNFLISDLDAETVDAHACKITNGVAGVDASDFVIMSQLPSGVLQFGTEDTILALTATSGLIYFGTDTSRLYVADGANWNMFPFPASIETSDPDMGTGIDSSRIGYGLTYITDKDLSNCRILGDAREEEGSVKTEIDYDDDLRYAYFYLTGEWKKVVTGFSFREDSTGALQHQPNGYVSWINAHSGNGVDLAENGLPFIQQYTASMGAVPVPLEIDGGEF